MHGKLILIVLFACLLSADAAFALRCGNETISIGDTKNEVRLKCGPPFAREEIGYIDRLGDDNARIRVMKIEEWIISISEYGTTYYYSLVFEGNVLTEIKDAGQKK